MRKRFLLLLFPVGCFFSFAFSQVTDDFADGNFTADPVWSGDVEFFQVVTEELRSNGPEASAILYLSTPQTRLNDTEWQFRIRLNFAPSNANRVRIYLTADQANLEGSLNGYYIGIGETGSDDSIDLFRQTGEDRTRILDGTDGHAGGGLDARIRVTRDGTGTWRVFSDLTGGSTFTLEGNVQDNTHTVSTHMGVYVQHTATRSDGFAFDDFYAGPLLVDNEAPQLVSANALSATQVELIFSEILSAATAGNTTNYLINRGIGNPSNANLDNGNPTRIVLTLPSPLIPNETYELQITNVADPAGNAISPVTVPISFVQAETAGPQDILINEFMADPAPAVGLPSAEFVELFNRSEKSINLEGWKLRDGSTTVGILPSFDLLPGTFVVLVRTADALQFNNLGPVISPDNWPNLNNESDQIRLMNANDQVIDSVNYLRSWYGDPNKDDGGYSLERINPENLSCSNAGNWRASVDVTGGTPGKQNSIFSTDPDQIPPEVIGVNVLSPDTLEICFSESMDLGSVEQLANYQFSPPVSITSLRAISPELQCVQMILGIPLERGVTYELTVSGAADCSGNVMAVPAIEDVAIGEPATAFDVVINEIFADDSPQVGLPEGEYIELYNRTEKVLDLTGWGIQDPSSMTNWGNLSLLPGEYLILTRPEYAAAYRNFGKVLEINLPGLGNASDSLWLVNSVGLAMDYVFYDDAWYQDDNKRSGGWSLERIDPNFTDCNNEENWRASVNGKGGSPGESNSIVGTFEDNKVPRLSGIQIVDAMTIQVFFTEQMDEATLDQVAMYDINNGIGTPSLSIPVGPGYRSTLLILDQELDDQTSYTLQVSGVSDCAGNVLSGEIPFGFPAPIAAGDIKLNEILFNPYRGGADFVEIANVSDKILDLKELSLGEIYEDTDSIFNAKPVSPATVLLFPGEVICLTREVAIQEATYQPPLEARFHQMSSFPSYDDAKGEVVLFTATDTLDRFRYLDDYHFPTLADDEGVSLERISLERPTDDPANWHSASSTVLYATPGYANSQAVELNPEETSVSIEPQTFSPNGDGQDDVLAIHYDFDFVGGNARIQIFDSNGRPIRILQQNTLLNPGPGTFFWDGRNEQNQKADIGMYVILFEVLNQQNGEKQVFKKVAVLADRF